MFEGSIWGYLGVLNSFPFLKWLIFECKFSTVEIYKFWASEGPNQKSTFFSWMSSPRSTTTYFSIPKASPINPLNHFFFAIFSKVKVVGDTVWAPTVYMIYIGVLVISANATQRHIHVFFFIRNRSIRNCMHQILRPKKLSMYLQKIVRNFLK